MTVIRLFFNKSLFERKEEIFDWIVRKKKVVGFVKKEEEEGKKVGKFFLRHRDREERREIGLNFFHPCFFLLFLLLLSSRVPPNIAKTSF